MMILINHENLDLLNINGSTTGQKKQEGSFENLEIFPFSRFRIFVLKHIILKFRF